MLRMPNLSSGNFGFFQLTRWVSVKGRDLRLEFILSFSIVRIALLLLSAPFNDHFEFMCIKSNNDMFTAITTHTGIERLSSVLS